MIELPEALTLGKQLNETVAGAAVEDVYPPTKVHRFCWFGGDPADYRVALSGARIVSAEGFGIFAEILFDNGMRLCVNDGVNMRLIGGKNVPKDYQLCIELSDGRALCCTVAMYGGIVLHDGSYDNAYYLKSRAALSPFDAAFPAYYHAVLSAAKPSLSAKAFLATEQRFPGVGNGVLQDILFLAGVHPKRKLAAISEGEHNALVDCTVGTLKRMSELGGRDTEKDLFGAQGGYRTLMSKNTLPFGCPNCGGPIVKETYLGGAVYYCPRCQPL